MHGKEMEYIPEPDRPHGQISLTRGAVLSSSRGGHRPSGSGDQALAHPSTARMKGLDSKSEALGLIVCSDEPHYQGVM